jgi:hypothetical protein
MAVRIIILLVTLLLEYKTSIIPLASKYRLESKCKNMLNSKGESLSKRCVKVLRECYRVYVVVYRNNKIFNRRLFIFSALLEAVRK